MQSNALAKDAIIVLSGCDVGNSGKSNTNLRPTWQQLLANRTQRVVYAAGGAESGTIIGYDAEVTKDLKMKESPVIWESRSNTYYKFYPQ